MGLLKYGKASEKYELVDYWPEGGWELDEYGWDNQGDVRLAPADIRSLNKLGIQIQIDRINHYLCGYHLRFDGRELYIEKGYETPSPGDLDLLTEHAKEHAREYWETTQFDTAINETASYPCYAEIYCPQAEKYFYFSATTWQRLGYAFFDEDYPDLHIPELKSREEFITWAEKYLLPHYGEDATIETSTPVTVEFLLIGGVTEKFSACSYHHAAMRMKWRYAPEAAPAWMPNDKESLREWMLDHYEWIYPEDLKIS
ncbi:hypothetical protein [Actinotignum sp. GS-2025b]|uniref:hypothetical protein n=1 Tax=Actinotignum sp. GS-2025b TaxID=3427275 RepID=UPI003F44BAC8